jgi:hypothetical protein
VWAIGVLLVLLVLGLAMRRFRGRPPARREAVAVAPVPGGAVPVGVRVRVDGGEQAAAPGPEKVTTGGRVRLGVRLADPRPKEGNLAQVPLGVGRVAVRMAEGEVPRPTEQPETVLAGRARVTMSDDQPEFWPGDGGSVILKRR